MSDVRVQFDVFVPMPDGVRLAGNLYLPDEPGPHPAILVYIPYLKDGYGGLGMLDAYHRHFAGRGYAVLQLDFRGTGSSEGVNPRFLEPSERQDGYDAVEWIAAQSWCTGDVGMWGLSYGGLTALSVAAMAPPHLRAIAPVHAPDDMFDSLIRHRGSRLMYWAEPHWGPAMAAMNLLPPLRSPAPGGAWVEAWRQRLEANTPWQLLWQGPPPYEGYWAQARVDPAKISVPAFIVCGWQDAYPDDAVRLFTGVRGPKRLLLGPWKHVLPDRAPVAPIGITAEIDRWWDRWLKGIDNGVEREPPVTIYVQGEGHWRHEKQWPLERARQWVLHLAPGGELALNPPSSAARDHYDYDARAGTAALAYDAVTHRVPYPADQSCDERLSLTYTTPPLQEALEVTGQPAVELTFSADTAPAEIDLVAKLSDVQPDGRSFLVTHENLSGAAAVHVGERDGHPAFRVDIPLRATSYLFAAGNCLRLAVSGANFPYVWPTPRRYALSVYTGPGGSRLSLPTAPAQEPPLPVPHLPPAMDLTPGPELDGGSSYSVVSGLTARTVEVRGERHTKNQIDEHSVFSRRQQFTMGVDADDPAGATTSEVATVRLERPSGAVDIEVRNTVTLSELYLHAEVRLDGEVCFERTWKKNR